MQSDLCRLFSQVRGIRSVFDRESVDAAAARELQEPAISAVISVRRVAALREEPHDAFEPGHLHGTQPSLA